MGAYLLWSSGANAMFFDIVENENHSWANLITDHPVEEGVAVTDHVRPQANKVTVTGHISNTPIYSAAGRDVQIPLTVPKWSAPFVPTPGAVFGAAEDALPAAATALFGTSEPLVAHVFAFPDTHNFVQETLTVLSLLRSAATIIKVVTPHWSYDDMIIENVEFARDSTSGTGASISVSLKQIRIVESSLVAAPVPSIPRAAPSKAKGNQAPVAPDGPQSSLLFSLTQNDDNPVGKAVTAVSGFLGGQ